MEFIGTVPALLAVLLHIVSASPGPIVTPPPISQDSQCVPTSWFPDDHICKTLFVNVSYITVPNPLTYGMNGNPNVLFQQAMDNFQHFYVAFADTEDFCGKKDFCSNKVFTLLCFFYFPICIPGGNGNPNVTVFPCKDTCKEVTDENSECTQRLLQVQADYGHEFEDKAKRGWQHFNNCNATYKNASHTVGVFNSSICVNFIHSSTLPPNTLVPERPKRRIVKELGDDCSAIDDRFGPGCKCDPRQGISKSTFLNNPYNYAFECQANSNATVYGREAINCTVMATYSVAETSAEVNDTILVLGVKKSKDCEESCFKTVVAGRKYLIAGNYVKRPKCSTNLFFSTKIGEKKAMIAPSSDRNIRRMEGAVDRFRNVRCSGH